MDRDRKLARGLRLVRRDVTLFSHPAQRVVSTNQRAIGMQEWTLARVALNDARNRRGLIERELLRRFAKNHARRGLHAVRAMAEVDLIAVHREDLLLRVPLLDLHGDKR